LGRRRKTRYFRRSHPPHLSSAFYDNCNELTVQVSFQCNLSQIRAGWHCFIANLTIFVPLLWGGAVTIATTENLNRRGGPVLIVNLRTNVPLLQVGAVSLENSRQHHSPTLSSAYVLRRHPIRDTVHRNRSGALLSGGDHVFWYLSVNLAATKQWHESVLMPQKNPRGRSKPPSLSQGVSVPLY
jgi:hypothetical protein